MKKVVSIEIRYGDGTAVWIEQRDIEKWEQAADALETLERAKAVAKRLLG